MKRSSRFGFTLVELLVVIVIIGMLVALLIPAVQAARGRARQAQCTNNLTELAKATQTFTVDKGNFPGWKAGDVNTAASAYAYGWVPQIFAQMGRNDLNREVLANPTGTSWHVYLPGLVCPADPPTSQAGTPLSYVANAGRPDNPVNKQPPDWSENGVFMYRVKDKRHPIQNLSLTGVKDGQGTTILYSENVDATNWTDVAAAPEEAGEAMTCIVWTAPADSITQEPFNDQKKGSYSPVDYRHARPTSMHGGSFMVVFCDGHTQAVNEEVDPTIYALMMTPNGAESRNPGAPTPKGSSAQTGVFSQADIE